LKHRKHHMLSAVKKILSTHRDFFLGAYDSFTRARTYKELKQIDGELDEVSRSILSSNPVSIVPIEVGVGVDVSGKWTQLIQPGGLTYES
jgi:hypothetical protein